MVDERDDEENETEYEDEESEEYEDEDEESDEHEDDEESDDEDDEESDDEDDEESEEYEDDEGSDDEDDEGSDDEASDEQEPEEDDEPAKAAPSSKRRPKGKSAKRAQKHKSAAARLAAARAAKAARKAAKRGKERLDEKDPLEAASETAVVQSAARAGDWVSENRPVVYGVIGALLLLFVGGIGWTEHTKGQREEAGRALATAIEISTATIRAEDAEPAEDTDDDAPSYPTAAARAEAALAAFESVITDSPDSDAAGWAQLGRGEMLLELERYPDARGAFEAAIAAAGDDDAILWRALEGKGFTYEAEEDWGEALSIYQELGRIDEMRFDPIAKYHTARMYIAQGETEEATETLSTLVESLRGAADDEEEQSFAYVLAQAEIRLRELDPSAVPARPSLGGLGGLGGAIGGGPGGAGGPGGPGGMTQEQLQEFIRQFQQKQQQQGGGGAGE